MKTLSVLNRKAVLSWFYLLIAIGLVWVTFMPHSGLYYIQTKWVYSTNYNQSGYGSYEDVTNLFSVLLWATALMYFMHFIYGAIYYPVKYRRILRQFYVGSGTMTDLSWVRGIIATAYVWIVVYLSMSDQFSSNAQLWWILSAVWLLFNLCLCFVTQTGSLFGKSSVTLDQYAIAPWLYGKEPEDKCDYITIYFIYPVAAVEEKWKKLIAIGYADSLLRAHEEESDVNAAADQLTQTVLTEAHPR